MCKAGFAGDDAPRAVFRKSSSSRWVRLTSSELGDLVLHVLLQDI